MIDIIQNAVAEIRSQSWISFHKALQVVPVLAAREVKAVAHQHYEEGLLWVPRMEVAGGAFTAPVGVFKALEIYDVQKLEYNRWKSKHTDAINSVTTVQTLLEFYNTVSFHQDDLASRVSLAHLPSHLLSTTVTDEEIFESLEYAYKHCKKTPRDIRSRVIKKIFLFILVRGRSDLTTGKNRTHFNRLVGLHPDLLCDFISGTLYYFDVYGKKG
jgi:hypothetical protein